MKTCLYDLRLFRVRNSFDDIKSQTGVFYIFENAVEAAKKSRQNVYNHKKECVWNYKEDYKNGKV